MRYLLLLLTLSISGATAQELYPKVHARNEIAREFAECAAYTALVGSMEYLPEKMRRGLAEAAKYYKDEANKLTSEEVTNFNIFIDASRFYTLAVQTGNVNSVIEMEQDKCTYLIDHVNERYEYWVKNPRKGFLD